MSDSKWLRLRRAIGRRSRPDTPRRTPRPIDPHLVAEVSASGLFDPTWYVERYPDLARFPPGPLAHFCEHGLFEHRDPGPNFETALYLKRSPAADTASPPFLRALRAGDWQHGIPSDVATFTYLVRQSGLFDEGWYLERYYDVARAKADALDHFTDRGARELRDPGPDFDSEFYAETYPDYQERCRSPIEHYLRIGRSEGKLPKGSSKYQRWISAFDVLTDTDVAYIRRNGEEVALPPVTILHLPAAEDAVARVDLGAEAQIGANCRTLTLGRMQAEASDVILRAAQAAVEALSADGVVLLCAGAVSLRPHAAYAFASALTQTGARAAYCDHDHLGADGERIAPVFKPAMSPEFMRRLPYAGPVVALRPDDAMRARIVQALAAAAGGSSAAHWATLLCTLPPTEVIRLPFVLYHRTDAPVGNRRILEPVPDEPLPPLPFAREDDASLPSVRIIIPTRDGQALLQSCIESIVALSDYPRDRYTIVVVDNGSREEVTLAYFDTLRAEAGVEIVPSPGPFNFARICNEGAAGGEEDILLFLNNDTTVRQADWLRRLVAFAGQPEIGAVGAQLLYPDDTVQHGGVILGIQGVGAHRLVGVEADVARRTDVTREMSAVTGACIAVRRTLFECVGGLDPILGVAFNDVTLCTRLLEAGYRNIYIAEPLLYHHESKSRGFDVTWAQQLRNGREAIYARERYASFFRNDLSYNPNLSLQLVGRLAAAPRVVRPWRCAQSRRRKLLLLSATFGFGQGVAVVMALQAAFLRARGWEVIAGGPQHPHDIALPGCERVGLWSAQAAAAFAVRENVDVVLAHTPPFFSVTRFLGAWPLVYYCDHGEPPPRLFANEGVRQSIDLEKRFCAPLAAGVFTISRAIFDQQFRKDAVVVRNGNSHLTRWSPEWAARREVLRRKWGFEGAFVVLNVCRFTEDDRRYKGIAHYADVASELPYLYPEIAGKIVFALAGRGQPEDVAYARGAGLTPFANVSDADLTELYAASDLYVSLSQWEGYNLGIGQALAMGLDVVASDIPAHREFAIETSNDVPRLCAAVARRYEAWAANSRERCAIVEPWDEPLARLAAILEDKADAAPTVAWS